MLLRSLCPQPKCLPSRLIRAIAGHGRRGHAGPARNTIFPLYFTLLAFLGAAAADAAPRAGFGKSHPFRSEELPNGKLKAKLETLAPKEKQRAMAWLHTFDFSASDAASHLRVDAGGGIFIACPDHLGTCEGHTHGTGEEPAGAPENMDPVPAPITDSLTTESISVSADSPPAYHSRPTASKRIYLDFNGGIVSGTAWNTSKGVTSWNVKAWSQDTDRTTFNDAEQAWMKSVWQRVAEDYAPFDVDVTTDTSYDPDNYTGNKDNVGWLMICETTDANGVALPHNGSGGIAYVSVFGDSSYSPTYQPAWVSSTNGGGSESVIAEAASHEMGHNMGLSHDGTSTLAYYGGHGSGDTSWGPLMGTGYNRNVSQWSKGEYYDANQLQDDLAIISARVPYRSDDHGNTPGTATPLTITNRTTISSTTPENDPSNSTPDNKGIIERNTDVDVFSFYTGNGSVQLNANPWIMPASYRGGNLDILLELYDETGSLVASNNATNLTYASISTTLTQGYYYLYVRNSGTGTPLAASPSGYTAYGSIGQYFISGSIVDADPPFTLTSVTPASGFAGPLTFDLLGTGLLADTSVKLSRSGHADIPATTTQLIGSTLRCQIDLTGAATGAWDIVATNPNLETFTLPTSFTVTEAIWAETFDSQTTDWTSQATTGTNSWALTTAQSQSPSTSFFAPAPASRTTCNLTSPAISIPASATNLQLKFWHSYNLETSYDAGKIEFSIDGGTWFDVAATGSGASFANNGYNTTVNSGTRWGRNEFAGQQAWSGNSNGFIETLINLTNTAAYAGHSLRIRWRIATDSTTSSTGWYVDSISLTGDAATANQPPIITAAASTSSDETETDPDTMVYQVIRSTETNLSVTATDDGGESSLTYYWSATGGQATPVTFTENATNTASNTTAIFQSAGDYQISVSVADSASLSTTNTIHVRVRQTADRLVVSPLSASVQFATARQFSADLFDQFGALITSQPTSFTWSVSGGGAIDPTGLFTATAAGGPHLITAASGLLSTTASVTITPAPATITLTNLTQTYDGNPKPVTVTTEPPEIATSVTISYNNLADVPTDAGTYTVIATIDDPNYEGTSTTSLVIAPGNDFISWKNNHFTEDEQIAGLAEMIADPDFDNFPNLAEYALGTDPRLFTPPLIPTLDANGLTLTFTRPAGLPGLLYFAESADDLGNWSPIPLEIITPGNPETVSARDPLATGDPTQRFLRLRFETP